MELVDVILSHFDNPAVLGVALGPLVVAIVGVIRHYTQADGPVVKWIALGVSLGGVVLYNIIEGGMDLTNGLTSAVIGAVVAIGSHETGGKWLREMFGVWLKKPSEEQEST